jgi:hypothetical protein
MVALGGVCVCVCVCVRVFAFVCGRLYVLDNRMFVCMLSCALADGLFRPVLRLAFN